MLSYSGFSQLSVSCFLNLLYDYLACIDREGMRVLTNNDIPG